MALHPLYPYIHVVCSIIYFYGISVCVDCVGFLVVGGMLVLCEVTLLASFSELWPFSSMLSEWVTLHICSKL